MQRIRMFNSTRECATDQPTVEEMFLEALASKSRVRANLEALIRANMADYKYTEPQACRLERPVDSSDLRTNLIGAGIRN